jgi:hypothetical protein
MDMMLAARRPERASKSTLLVEVDQFWRFLENAGRRGGSGVAARGARAAVRADTADRRPDNVAENDATVQSWQAAFRKRLEEAGTFRGSMRSADRGASVPSGRGPASRFRSRPKLLPVFLNH